MAQLFGISGKSNRDGNRRTHWGKNEFNSSFPASLLCYMDSKGVKPVYLKLNNELEVRHSKIPANELFGLSPLSQNIYFSFEDSFTPFQEYVIGSLQRSDLVIMDTTDSVQPKKRGLEIKLTALPDNSTYDLEEDHYSCELVFRPPAIESLSLSIAHIFSSRREELLQILNPVCSAIYNWRSRDGVSEHISDFIDLLENVSKDAFEEQIPFAIQPVWKTIGKSANLAENCLDVFVWSNLAFTRLFIESAKSSVEREVFDRNIRTVIWVCRMLYDFAHIGRMEPSRTTSELAFEIQNDKAFAISGKKTWNFLKSTELTNPRIKKTEIKEIILDGGQNELSPERRFDAVIVNTPGLFD